MELKSKNIYLIVMAITFALGLILIFSSVSIGRNMASNLLNKMGGMDTNEYRLIIKSYIEAIKTGGIIISLLGGIGTLISSYTLYNNIKK